MIHQLENKQFLWKQLSEAALDGNTYWKVGYKVVLLADQVLIYSAGHKGFNINLRLSRETVQQILLQALML